VTIPATICVGSDGEQATMADIDNTPKSTANDTFKNDDMINFLILPLDFTA
jgi:hypothetical protein